MLNIPISRAKKINSDEYIEGDYISILNIIVPLGAYLIGGYIIDPTTLAIHFPNMLAKDSNRLLPNGEKDLRIFTSLNEDGKGGDCTFMENGYNEVFCYDSINGCIVLKSPNSEIRLFGNGRGKSTFHEYKIVGIQQ